ncbi:MAG: O-antigen ligase family protein [Saprospiraceae bacterium]|nr:O-antigen ligase family protein [Saprospiraceae bacterium]
MPASSIPYVSNDRLKVFYSFVAFVAIAAGLALVKEMYLLALAPVALLGLLLIIRDYSLLYYAFWVTLPFSIEFYLGSFGTDLPTEPIMLALTCIGILLFLLKFKSISLSYIYHPISIFLFLHLIWLFFTSIFSQSPTVSYKFFLAKLWYVIPFFFLTFHFIKSSYSIEKITKLLSVFLGIAVAIVLTRHSMEGFTFDTSHQVVRPIFRNHVSYSAILVVVLPFIWAFYQNEKNVFIKRLLVGVIGLFVVGTYFSYTRAAQLSVVIAIGAYFIFKFRFAKIAVTASLIVAIIGSGYLMNNNKYLDFAPDFEKTVAHTKFDNLLEATYKMEDISTMERVYRWVAAAQMIEEKPFIGFGPGSFYFHYQKYTINSFETYVSDNPEKSGIHNYYLMTLVEQGILGLILFIGLVVSIVLYGERLYHELTNKRDKSYIMAATISTVVICALLIINDLIEVDKVGPFFFLNASLIVLFDLKNRGLILKGDT